MNLPFMQAHGIFKLINFWPEKGTGKKFFLPP
jgi:hypothetical protein